MSADPGNQLLQAMVGLFYGRIEKINALSFRSCEETLERLTLWNKIGCIREYIAGDRAAIKTFPSLITPEDTRKADKFMDDSRVLEAFERWAIEAERLRVTHDRTFGLTETLPVASEPSSMIEQVSK